MSGIDVVIWCVIIGAICLFGGVFIGAALVTADVRWKNPTPPNKEMKKIEQAIEKALEE